MRINVAQAGGKLYFLVRQLVMELGLTLVSGRAGRTWRAGKRSNEGAMGARS